VASSLSTVLFSHRLKFSPSKPTRSISSFPSLSPSLGTTLPALLCFPSTLLPRPNPFPFLLILEVRSLRSSVRPISQFLFNATTHPRISLNQWSPTLPSKLSRTMSLIDSSVSLASINFLSSMHQRVTVSRNRCCSSSSEDKLWYWKDCEGMKVTLERNGEENETRKERSNGMSLEEWIT